MNIEQLAAELESAAPHDEQSLEQFRIRFLGSKNVLKDLYAAIKDIPNEQKRSYGLQVNALKERAEQKFLEAKTKLTTVNTGIKKEDLSKPSADTKVGAHHPLSLIRSEILSIFKRIGFRVLRGGLHQYDRMWNALFEECYFLKFLRMRSFVNPFYHEHLLQPSI